MSSKPYAGVICDHCGFVDIDEQEYNKQMDYPNRSWTCPKCGDFAHFDDNRFEELNDLDSSDE